MTSARAAASRTRASLSCSSSATSSECSAPSDATRAASMRTSGSVSCMASTRIAPTGSGSFQRTLPRLFTAERRTPGSGSLSSDRIASSDAVETGLPFSSSPRLALDGATIVVGFCNSASGFAGVAATSSTAGMLRVQPGQAISEATQSARAVNRIGETSSGGPRGEDGKPAQSVQFSRRRGRGPAPT